MADNYVITISRQNGSGGNMIGRLVSDKLKIPFYDKKLLRLASDKSGIAEDLFGAADEQLTRKIRLAAAKVYTGELLPPSSDEYTSELNLFTYQAEIIKELASTESCVIVGRCGDYILRESKNVMRVFIHAQLEDRIKRQMYVLPHLSEAEVRRRIIQTDKKRGEYYRRFTGSDWMSAEHFDISIDTTLHTPENAANIIIDSLEVMFKNMRK